MKNVCITMIFGFLVVSSALAQPIERICSSLPLFAASSDVNAIDGTLTIGLFSDVQTEVEPALLTMFEKLKTWNRETVKKACGLKKVIAVSLNSDNLDDFKGQVIWVLDAEASLEKLKEKTTNGFFTIGSQQSKFEDYLFITVIYTNKSDDPNVERWRLSRIFANCDISQYRASPNLMVKEGFEGKNCD